MFEYGLKYSELVLLQNEPCAHFRESCSPDLELDSLQPLLILSNLCSNLLLCEENSSVNANGIFMSAVIGGLKELLMVDALLFDDLKSLVIENYRQVAALLPGKVCSEDRNE